MTPSNLLFLPLHLTRERLGRWAPLGAVVLLGGTLVACNQAAPVVPPSAAPTTGAPTASAPATQAPSAATGSAASPNAATPATAAPGATAAPPPAPPVSVTTTRAQQKDLAIILQTTGTVSALSSIDIRSQVSSVITKVNIREGQFVRKGDLLFTLDSRSDEANIAKANAQLAKDQASLADAQRQLARSKQLVAQNFVSQGAVDTAQASVDAQTAAIAADRAAVDAARVPLSNARIVAPSAGRVGLIPVFVGSAVQANQTPLVTITQLDPIAVTFNLPQRNLQDVLAILQRGDGTVRAVLPETVDAANAAAAAAQRSAGRPSGGAGSAPPPAEGGKPMVAPPNEGPSKDAAKANPASDRPPKPSDGVPGPTPVPNLLGQIGKLSFVDTMVDSASGTVKAKAQFANTNNAFWPGAFVNISVQVQAIKDAIVIPQVAIVQTARGAIVYVIDKENKASIRPVQILQSQGEEAAVSGLRPGEKIAIEGRSNLRPGSTAIERARESKGGESKGGPESKGGDLKAPDSKAPDSKAPDLKGPSSGPPDAKSTSGKPAEAVKP